MHVACPSMTLHERAHSCNVLVKRAAVVLDDGNLPAGILRKPIVAALRCPWGAMNHPPQSSGSSPRATWSAGSATRSPSMRRTPHGGGKTPAPASQRAARRIAPQGVAHPAPAAEGCGQKGARRLGCPCFILFGLTGGAQGRRACADAITRPTNLRVRVRCDKASPTSRPTGSRSRSSVCRRGPRAGGRCPPSAAVWSQLALVLPIAMLCL